MGNIEKFTPEQISAAIEKSHGLISVAAKSLGCSRQTIVNYIERHNLQPIVDAARGGILDIAEEKLLSALEAGDFRAVAFTLRCLGRERGWVEKSDVNLSGEVGVKLPQVFLPVKVLDNDTDELTVDPSHSRADTYHPPMPPVAIFTPPTPQPQPPYVPPTPPTPQPYVPQRPVLAWRPPGTIPQDGES